MISSNAELYAKGGGGGNRDTKRAGESECYLLNCFTPKKLWHS